MYKILLFFGVWENLAFCFRYLLSFNRVKALVCALTFYSNRSDHTVPF